MTEENIKLIARIQHFYDIMNKMKDKYELELMVSSNKNGKDNSFQIINEYLCMLSEYERIFESFLYQEKL